MRNFSFRLFALATAFAVPSLAHADDMFTVTDAGNTYTFTLPASPVNPPVSGQHFSVTTSVTEDGTITRTDTLEFYTQNPSDEGGFSDSVFGLSLANNALFSGTTSAPTFLIGSFAETDGYPIGSPNPTPNDATVLISSGSTPEPSSIALLGTGLLGIVGVARRRFKK